MTSMWMHSSFYTIRVALHVAFQGTFYVTMCALYVCIYITHSMTLSKSLSVSLFQDAKCVQTIPCRFPWHFSMMLCV